MPLYVIIDFRADGHLGAWWSRSAPSDGFSLWANLKTTVNETTLRNVFHALADELDPISPNGFSEAQLVKDKQSEDKPHE
jgi:hypothetical protein